MSFPAFTKKTTANEVASAFSDLIRGKNVLVTGTSIGGLGFETARAIARYANLVIITGYNLERLKLSEEALKKEYPSANVRPLVLDLSTHAATRKAAAEVLAYPEPVHVLINNAIASIGPFRLTSDGLEIQMATDHVNPFLFTNLIAPKLLAARTVAPQGYTPRVVFVSSLGHAFAEGGFDFAAVRAPRADAHIAAGAYAQAKTANVLTAVALSKRSHGKINAYSLHPGTIYTNIDRNLDTKETLQAIGVLLPDGSQNPEREWKSLGEGAATTVVAAFDPRLDDTPGAYLQDCVPAPEAAAAHATDPAAAEKLWVLTEEIVGEKFVF